jgi:hypothetical protein
MRIEKSLDRDVVVGDTLSGRAGKQGPTPSCSAGAGAVEGEHWAKVDVTSDFDGARKCPVIASDDNVACRRLIHVYPSRASYIRAVPVKMNVEVTLVSEVLPCEPRVDPQE